MAEIFSVGGLVIGVVLLLIALVAKLFDGGWVATRAAVEHDEHGPFVRWIGDDGAVYEHGLTRAQFAHVGTTEWTTVYSRRRAAHRMRVDPHSAVVRVFRLLGGIVTGVGVLALAVSLVVMFIAG